MKGRRFNAREVSSPAVVVLPATTGQKNFPGPGNRRVRFSSSGGARLSLKPGSSRSLGLWFDWTSTCFYRVLRPLGSSCLVRVKHPSWSVGSPPMEWIEMELAKVAIL
jgi:hypothetical protein